MTIKGQAVTTDRVRYRQALQQIAAAESGRWGVIAHEALRGHSRPATYRLWVNDTRTVLVRLWDTGRIEVATRPDRNATWGPPTWLAEEKL